MQVDQIVVSRSRECPLRANPEDTPLDACESSSSFCFGEVAITAFVILHTCLSDGERTPVELAHDIGEVIMRLSFKCVANGKGGILWGGQAVGRGKRMSDVATGVAGNKRVIFEPFLLVVVHFPHKSRMYAWIPSVLNIHKQH
jgi:hypothetical protein